MHVHMHIIHHTYFHIYVDIWLFDIYLHKSRSYFMLLPIPVIPCTQITYGIRHINAIYIESIVLAATILIVIYSQANSL
jgi:hypothetical protein